MEAVFRSNQDSAKHFNVNLTRLEIYLLISLTAFKDPSQRWALLQIDFTEKKT